MYERIPVLSQPAHGGVIRLYVATGHVSELLEDLSDECLIHFGIRVQGLELDVYRDDRRHGGIMEDWLRVSVFRGVPRH